MIFNNIILLTDSYKASHHLQYPPNTTKIYSYLEARGGGFGETVFFGLQYYLKRYLSKPITQDDIEEAYHFFKDHMGNGIFNRNGWEYILHKYGGKLPVSIKAVPEGTVVPTSNALMTIESTDPNCFWLTNYLETILAQVWYGCSVATLSREMKKLILKYLKITGDPSLIDFKLHDFGFRGVSSVESAGIGGAAHLVNFKGTDTMAGVLLARNYYDCPMAGFNIPAAEHSTITSWTKDGEVDAYRNMVNKFGDYHHYAVVSDSYDIYEACSRLWGETLRNDVLNAKGTLVVRPDSGVPHVVVLNVLEILGDKFGYSMNGKGYKVLSPKVRVIQGDGIGYDETERILDHMITDGWSADNITFGMGGGLLQKTDRDKLGFVVKCSYVEVNGESRDVFKNPITDKGKMSKKGKLALVRPFETNGNVRIYGGYKTAQYWGNYSYSSASPFKDELVEVYRDGELLINQSFDEIRARAVV